MINGGFHGIKFTMANTVCQPKSQACAVRARGPDSCTLKKMIDNFFGPALFLGPEIKMLLDWEY